MKRAIFLSVVLLVVSPVFAENQGYCKSFTVNATIGEPSEPNDVNFFTVPINEEFVLSTVYVTATGSGTWSLTAGENFAIGGTTTTINLYQSPRLEKYEFPNPVALIKTDETLVLSWTPNLSPYCITVTIIGYFGSAGAESLSSDLNGDGKVNFVDFSMMAAEWLFVE